MSTRSQFSLWLFVFEVHQSKRQINIHFLSDGGGGEEAVQPLNTKAPYNSGISVNSLNWQCNYKWKSSLQVWYITIRTFKTSLPHLDTQCQQALDSQTPGAAVQRSSALPAYSTLVRFNVHVPVLLPRPSLYHLLLHINSYTFFRIQVSSQLFMPSLVNVLCKSLCI